MNSLKPLLWALALMLCAIGVVLLAVRAIRWAKKGGKGASMFTAAAFPFPDQPPPQEQVEQVNRLKKSAEAGDPKDEG